MHDRPDPNPSAALLLRWPLGCEASAKDSSAIHVSMGLDTVTSPTHLIAQDPSLWSACDSMPGYLELVPDIVEVGADAGL
jgi:hypothetical protein